MESTGGKFLGCLCQQIEAVNDKIKLRNLALLLVVVSQIADIMECQCSFSAKLYEVITKVITKTNCEKVRAVAPLWKEYPLFFTLLMPFSSYG